MATMKVENVNGEKFDVVVIGGAENPGVVARIDQVSMKDIEWLVRTSIKKEPAEEPVAINRIDGSKLVRLRTRSTVYAVDPAKLQKELDAVTGARCRAFAPQDDGSHLQCAMNVGHGGDHAFYDDKPSNELKEILQKHIDQVKKDFCVKGDWSEPALAPSRHPETELL